MRRQVPVSMPLVRLTIGVEEGIRPLGPVQHRPVSVRGYGHHHQVGAVQRLIDREAAATASGSGNPAR